MSGSISTVDGAGLNQGDVSLTRRGERSALVAVRLAVPKATWSAVSGAVNVNRDNVNQVVHDYIESTPKYDPTNFFAQWSVALP
jgi:hypothetical protein